MIQHAKTSEEYKNALEVASQYGSTNAYEEESSHHVARAFDHDDIRRMKRFLREWQEQEAEEAKEKDASLEDIHRKLKAALKSRDAGALEEALPTLKELVKGTRKHARRCSAQHVPRTREVTLARRAFARDVRASAST